MIDLGREIGMTTKYDEEKRFWKDEISFYVRWFHGRIKELYGITCPKQHEKIQRFSSEELNAIETWINADKWRYCKRLHIEPTYFSGKRVLEVGSGPLGLSRFFAGATVHLLDPLHGWYDKCGYIRCPGTLECTIEEAEEMWISPSSYDAVISVNAIDHVDSFEKAIEVCEKVCDDDGEIRMDIHYHAPTVTEPHVLNDEIVAAAFKRFDMKKVAENPSRVFYPRGTHPDSDRFAVWSNRDYVYDAVRSL
jgi:2-polyprenyl-3-methyl-5-hydroxy-6-metoxy-1,4-benzoquinol methylase